MYKYFQTVHSYIYLIVYKQQQTITDVFIIYIWLKLLILYMFFKYKIML